MSLPSPNWSRPWTAWSTCSSMTWNHTLIMCTTKCRVIVVSWALDGEQSYPDNVALSLGLPGILQDLSIWHVPYFVSALPINCWLHLNLPAYCHLHLKLFTHVVKGMVVGMLQLPKLKGCIKSRLPVVINALGTFYERLTGNANPWNKSDEHSLTRSF